MLEEKLKKIGFNSKEIEIYLIIYKYKQILPATISYLSKINRTTVYSLLKVLIEKNLISEEIKDGKKEVFCLPVENLNNLIYREKLELEKKKENCEWNNYRFT